MLGLQGYDTIAGLPGARWVGAREMRRALDREIVGFGGTRGEHDFPRIGVDQRGDITARALDGLRRNAAIGMARTVGMAVIFGEIRQHRLKDARIDPG